MPQFDKMQSKVIFARGLQNFVSTNGPVHGKPALLFTVPMCRWREHKPSEVAFVHSDHRPSSQLMGVTPGVQAARFSQPFTSFWSPEQTMFPELRELWKSKSDEAGVVVEISRLRCRLVDTAPQPLGQADQSAHAPHLQ